MAQRVTITEHVPLAEAAANGVLLGDAVREAGLDPDLYLAVVPAECGMAGRVNGNGRIYDPDETIREHARISAEASDRVVAGEAGHPEAGPTFNVAVRFLGGGSRVEEDGAVITEGRFAFLATQAGRDVLTCWKAGIPVGPSWKATGLVEEHVLDDDSPYIAMNEARRGERVTRVRGLRLAEDAYDMVRVPGAGTYLKTYESQEVREALQRLTESEAVDPPEEREMTFEELLSKHPELVESIRQKALTEAQAAEAGKLTEQVETLSGERETLREQVVALEAERDTLKEERDAAVTERDALKAANERATLRKQVVESVDAAIAGKPYGGKAKEYVLTDFDAGRFESVDEAAAALGRFLDIGKAAGNSTVGNAGEPVPAGEGGADDVNESKTFDPMTALNV